MPDGFTGKPRILRGAFVEYGLTLPPLLVVFQFNPEQLSRSRSLHYSAPGRATRLALGARYGTSRGPEAEDWWISLREFHGREEYEDLSRLQEDQRVEIQEESISFEIRLDATDKLNEGDALAGQFGVSPALATLELMMHPKGESLLGGLVGSLLGAGEGGFSFTRKPNPPLVLFIWGRKRVLPVNINSMSITESEFSTDLNPIRATVAVSLTVIEGPNLPFTYSKAMKEVVSVLNLASLGEIAEVVIPG
jgi:hypothetical protein